MELLSQIVRNLVFLLLFFAFLEMLLPMKEVRKFVQVILGLFMVVTILNPLISILEEGSSIKLYDSSAEKISSSEDLQQILDSGKELQGLVVDTAREECRQELEDQAKATVLTIAGVAEAQAEVELLESGEINKVLLEVVMEEKTAVKEGGDSNDLLKVEKILNEIRQEVASTICLEPEKVEVNIINEKG